MTARALRSYEETHTARRDPDYWAWLAEHPGPCDACGRRGPVSRAHLVARSRGGGDRDNVVFLCDGPGDTCHRKQEKRTDAFIQECGVDLYERARAHTARYDAERDGRLPF